MQNKIGDKITWSKKDKETVVQISGSMEGWMMQALLAWLILWSTLGVYVLYYLFTKDLTREESLFFTVYLVFWGYFEWKTLYAYLFKLKGFELIQLSADGLHIKRKVLFMEKANHFRLENIKKFEVIDSDNRSFGAVYQKSFWVVGNERIGFQNMNKKAAFGYQLEDADAKNLAHLMNRALKKLP